MTIVAFAGPSLCAADRAAYPKIAWRPPAEAGDLLRLDAGRGDIVCLIDGYFDHRPAVRHKELLLLLSRGVAVLGASSIGALRAAEMESVGMTGIGAIFRAFASGRLSADDEVALIHGPVEWHWKPLSLPLVDCRGSLCRAVRDRMLDPAAARSALRAAKTIHYADRDWPAVLAMAELTSNRSLDWLAASGSQKRIDALACLEAASSGAFRTPPAPPMVATSLVRALARECGLDPAALC